MYWLILLRPNSPSRLSAWSDGHDARHQLHDDRRVDVRVHPQRHDREVRQAAAREQVEQAGQRVALDEDLQLRLVDARDRAPTPAGGRRSAAPRTYRIRRRMSGARKALRSDSNTGQASSPVGRLGLVGRGRLVGIGVGVSSVAVRSPRRPRSRSSLGRLDGRVVCGLASARRLGGGLGARLGRLVGLGLRGPVGGGASAGFAASRRVGARAVEPRPRGSRPAPPAASWGPRGR